MAKDGIDQNQLQNVNIEQSEHGVVWDIKCPHVRHPHYSEPRFKKHGFTEPVHKIQVLIFKGKLDRNYCHHFVNNRCESSVNESKRCHISESS